MCGYNHVEVERKWAKVWEESGIWKAERKSGKKFFLIFAYPGASGLLHAGHMRGFTYSDIITRWKRMRGYDVLFPAGVHASGIPAVAFAKKVETKDPLTISQLKELGLDEATIERMKEPETASYELMKIYISMWKQFGFLIDWSRTLITISPDYKKFITWQFEKLMEKGLLVKKEHHAPLCPNCGPVAVDPSETDISRGGNAEILEFTLLKFKYGNYYLPAATLRPETIFGVTNIWLNPNIRYVTVELGTESYIMSEEAAKKLLHQKSGRITGEIDVKEMLGRQCTAPVVNREVPILPGEFVDGNVATGVVMSVPAHAPYDWAALLELKENAEKYGFSKEEIGKIKPISLIDVMEEENPLETRAPVKPAIDHFPERGMAAVDICTQLGIKNTKCKEKLDEATNIVYKKEFHSGRLKHICGKYAGKRISEVKDMIKDDFAALGVADKMYEFSEEVICRCGARVMISVVPDQWFIRYSDATLKENAKAHSEKMALYPQSYHDEIKKVIDWYGDRACIRKGRWLGTEFPYKEGWIIEPISDSTLYPAFYIISKYVNEGVLKPEQINSAFFDYVFLGKGSGNPEIKEIQEKIRKDFEYWYPLDINLGGKEHKTVHFPVFLMNHVAILEEKNWPRGIFVNWHLTMKSGEKISKSKGGVVAIPRIAEKFGVDALRVYYAHAASPDADLEWDEENVLTYKSRVEKIFTQYEELSKFESEERKHLEEWLESRFARTLAAAYQHMEQFALRECANVLFFEFYNELRWYIKRGGKSRLAKKIYIDYLKCLAPFVPNICEEIWHLDHNSLISAEPLPSPESYRISEMAEKKEEYLQTLVEDIRNILKLVKGSSEKIALYVAPQWKQDLLKEISANITKEPGQIIKGLMESPAFKPHGKEIQKILPKLVQELKQKGGKEFVFDEYCFLLEAKDFLSSEFSVPVEVLKAEEFPVEKKAQVAMPLKPGIQVVVRNE
ncbi:MAG: leucine--tRNA ligase [Thermoplasmata archaeon]|nr:leucine--tRNA ligase [Thermoplasmata archaeon]